MAVLVRLQPHVQQSVLGKPSLWDAAIVAEDADFIAVAKRLDEVAQDNDRSVVPIVALTHPRNHCGREPLYRTNQWSYEVRPDWYVPVCDSNRDVPVFP